LAEKFSIKDYMRNLQLPFCPGCGCFSVINCFLRAIHESGYEDLRRFVFCSGIGCSSWIPSPYFEADSIHTTHGRSIPVATGVKLLRPDLNVVVFGGDGDIVGIGLSHLIHAARRNLDITVIMVNNMIYGMTGGQVAPTTPYKVSTTTTPYGNFEYPLDATKLVISVGASYAARWTTVHVTELKESIKNALSCKGFAFIEVVSQCPTMFGRRVGFKDVTALMQWFRENSIPFSEAQNMSEKELQGKILTGEFKTMHPRSTLVDNVYTLIKEAKKSED
jgi:2-oxoglutarate ferredoxin oxidoreductase subunit beta